MEGKRRSIQLQYSFIQHEQSRLIESISDCLKTICTVVKTANRGELQQLSQLNAELSARVTAAADDAELLQQKYSLLCELDPSEPPSRSPGADHVNSDFQSLSRDGSGVAVRLGDSSVPESGSFHSAAGRQDSVASFGSSQRVSSDKPSRRGDRNVAMRHLKRPDGGEQCGRQTERSPPGPASEVVSSADPEADRPPPPGIAPAVAAAAADDVMPSRQIDTRVMHEVTLVHREEHGDGDLLYLNLREDEPGLDALCQDLEALSADEQYLLGRPPPPGQLVFACWDGAWYRGKVERCSPSDAGTTVDVVFMDYGNYDSVPLEQCRRLPESMARMPVCAVQCTLLGAAAAPAGPLRQLQSLLLDALLPASASVRALFQRPAGGGPLQAELAVRVQVGADWKEVDVGQTLNRVLAVSPEDARQQVTSQNLALEQLMEPFVARPRRTPAGGQDRILDWLSAGQDRQDGQPASPDTEELPRRQQPSDRPPQPPSPPTPSADFASGEPVSPAKTPQTFIDPPKYRNLSVCWHSRPIYRVPLELCARKTHHNVIIVNAQDPEHFYLSFESEEAFDGFQRDMASVYGRLPAHPRQGLHRDLLRPGSFWAARSDADEWCRVVLLEELQPQGGDGVPSYRVHCVDYGDDMVVPAAHLRPMLEQFASQPVFIVRAACSGVAPLEGQTGYSEAARERLVDLVDVAGVNAHTVSSETTDECLAVVLYTVQDALVAPVTHWMAQEGLVRHWQVQEDVCASSQSPADVSPADVNPADVPLPADDDPSSEALPAAADDGWWLRRPGDRVRLPPAGAVVYVRVTAVVSPELFYVVLPFSAQSAQIINTDFSGHLRQLAADDNMETLAAAMRRFYGARPAEGALPAGQRPPAGSQVAVRWQGGWHRGALLTVQDDHAEVFLLDWGHTEPVPLEELRELMRRFQQLPPQAVPCALAAAGGAPRRWPAAAAISRLVALAQRGLLLAHVLAAPPTAPAGRLLVDLYHTTDDGDGVWASQALCAEQ